MYDWKICNTLSLLIVFLYTIFWGIFAFNLIGQCREDKKRSGGVLGKVRKPGLERGTNSFSLL